MRHKSTTDRVYAYVRQYIDSNGYSPSYREIGRGCYLAESTVRYHLKKLAAAGLLNVDSGKVRTIILTNADD